MRLALIADTHIPQRARDLPPGAWRLIAECDAVLHAGDVTVPALLGRLGALRPTWAVRGNNDRLPEMAALPERWEGEWEGVAVAVVRDGGPAGGRRDRLRRLVPASAGGGVWPQPRAAARGRGWAADGQPRFAH